MAKKVFKITLSLPVFYLALFAPLCLSADSQGKLYRCHDGTYTNRSDTKKLCSEIKGNYSKSKDGTRVFAPLNPSPITKAGSIREVKLTSSDTSVLRQSGIRHELSGRLFITHDSRKLASTLAMAESDTQPLRGGGCGLRIRQNLPLSKQGQVTRDEHGNSYQDIHANQLGEAQLGTTSSILGYAGIGGIVSKLFSSQE
jgi:hypothetical protein